MPHPLDEAHAKRRMELHERDAQAHRAMGETGRLSLLQRLADWRAQRKHDRLERKVRARENLKNHKPPTGTEGGPPGMGSMF